MHALLAGPYVGLVSAYFRWAKGPLSRMVGRFQTRAPLDLPPFTSLEEYAIWMAIHLRWRADPLGGVWDVFPSLEHLAWQLKQFGVARDDCDGLALFSAHAVRPFADAVGDIYVVTLVLNPVHLPVQQAAHVLCVFRSQGKWRVISNTDLYPRRYATFAEAVRENPYCRGFAVRFLEARTPDLRRVPPPAD